MALFLPGLGQTFDKRVYDTGLTMATITHVLSSFLVNLRTEFQPVEYGWISVYDFQTPPLKPLSIHLVPLFDRTPDVAPPAENSEAQGISETLDRPGSLNGCTEQTPYNPVSATNLH